MKGRIFSLVKPIVTQNRKGFTLMEILAVLLIIAVVLSFAVPALRSVRFEHRNSLAKAGVKKISEAMRSFYQNSKGMSISGKFTGDGLASIPNCTNEGASGVPGTAQDVNILQLFACGYLDVNDFNGLPYTFYSCAKGFAETECDGHPYAVAKANDSEEAGKKYSDSAYLIFLKEDNLSVTDTED